MKIVFVLNQRLPTQWAHGLQTVSMCGAFSRAGLRLELLVPTWEHRLGVDIRSYYGLGEEFGIRRVWAPDFRSRFLPPFIRGIPGTYWIAFWLEQLFGALSLSWRASRSKPDIIYAREEIVAIFSAMFGGTVIFEVHSYSRKRKLLYWLLRKLHVRLVCISHGLSVRMRGDGFSQQNILVCPNGYDEALFKGLPEKNEARRRVHLPANMPIILYAGHLYRWKGADVLAKAAASIEGLAVFVGGTRSDVDRFKALYGHIPNMMLVGHRPHNEILSWLRAADVLVLPNTSDTDISRLYTSPLKLFEYMASERPIVASSLPSIREILKENMAFFAKPDDSESFSATITNVLREHEEGARRAQRAGQSVKQYSWEHRARNIIAFL